MEALTTGDVEPKLGENESKVTKPLHSYTAGDNDANTVKVQQPCVDEDVPVREPKSKEDVPKKGKRRRSIKKQHGSSSPPEKPIESKYILVPEEFCTVKGNQSAELDDENKSFLWFLIKQVRPGMGLARVSLPTFLLEPRSFLDKMSDYYYHADYLSKAVGESDSLLRMKYVVRWYVSGLYKKPKGLKKPYNPILGETFRCMWTHPNGSRTFYMAEQVSQQPPVTALYVSNRQDGFVMSGSVTTKSKFYGNSTSAIMEGVIQLMLLPYGETYELTLPFVHCRGLLLGTLSMELGGHVTIVCPSTGYVTELEFHLNGLLSKGDETNSISGKIKFGTETLLTIEGHWDDKIVVRDSGCQHEQVLWEVTDEIKESRLPRYTIPIEEQHDNESEKLWEKVSDAITTSDHDAATVEKAILEKTKPNDFEFNKEWKPKYFKHDGRQWRYRYQDMRRWDVKLDIVEYEHNYFITTMRKRETSQALVPMQSQALTQYGALGYGSSDDVIPEFFQRASNRQLIDLLRQLLARQLEQSEEIAQLQEAVADIKMNLAKPKEEDPFRMTSTILAVILGVAMQVFVIMFWFGDGKLIPLPRKPF